MASRRRIVRQTETYRFSATPTISDHPLLMGELLRRGEIRSLHEAQFRAWIRDMVAALGLRIRQQLGGGRGTLDAPLADDGRDAHDSAAAGTDDREALRDTK